MDHNNEKFQDAQMDQIEQAENTNKFVLENLNLKQNRSKPKKSRRQDSIEASEK